MENLETEKNPLEIFVGDEVAKAFETENGLENLFEKLKGAVQPIVSDVSDKDGRDQVKALAYKVSRSKTLVDNFGKDLVSEIKAKSKVIDDKRKFWRESCDKLRDYIKAPLDAWEAEQERLKAILQESIDKIKNYQNATSEETPSGVIKDMIAEIKAIKITEEIFGDLLGEAKLSRYETLDVLESNLEKSLAFEDFQKKEAERIAHERHAREEEIKKQAALQARQQAEEKAKAEKEDLERRAIEAERKAKQAAEQERLKIQREEEAKKQAEIARQADVEHRKAINNSIVDAVCATGYLDQDQAREILRLIYNGEIPNLKILY